VTHVTCLCGRPPVESMPLLGVHCSACMDVFTKTRAHWNVAIENLRRHLVPCACHASSFTFRWGTTSRQVVCQRCTRTAARAATWGEAVRHWNDRYGPVDPAGRVEAP
jgi:hypothetical protein